MSEKAQDCDLKNGNTSSSNRVKKCTKTERKMFCFTLGVEISGLNMGQLNQVLKCLDDIHKFIFQLEKGTSETNYLHYQGSLWFKKKKSFTWLKRIHNSIHVEEMRNEMASIAYCCKSESKVQGPLMYNMNMPYMGDDLPNIKDLKPWQLKILEIINGPVHPRASYWFWSKKGNMGKSTFAKYLIFHYNAQEVGSRKADIACATNGDSNIFVLDFSKTVEDYVSYDAIESLKNGKIFSPKYESRMKIFSKPHIFAFANFKPDTEAMMEDRWIIEQVDNIFIN